TGKAVLAEFRAVFKIAGDRRAPFDADPSRFGPARDGQPRGNRSRLDSGQGIETLLDLTVQLDPRYEFLAAGAAGVGGATILVVGHIDLQREQPASRES